jgi:hypothetical protein
MSNTPNDEKNDASVLFLPENICTQAWDLFENVFTNINNVLLGGKLKRQDFSVWASRYYQLYGVTSRSYGAPDSR